MYLQKYTKYTKIYDINKIHEIETSKPNSDNSTTPINSSVSVGVSKTNSHCQMSLWKKKDKMNENKSNQNLIKIMMLITP